MQANCVMILFVTIIFSFTRGRPPPSITQLTRGRRVSGPAGKPTYQLSHKKPGFVKSDFMSVLRFVLPACSSAGIVRAHPCARRLPARRRHGTECRGASTGRHHWRGGGVCGFSVCLCGVPVCVYVCVCVCVCVCV